MKNENGHQFYFIFKGFFIKFSSIRALVTKREWEETIGQVISFFYHVFGDGLDSLVQICNQLLKGRIQGFELVAA